MREAGDTFFKFVCILTTIALVVWCCYEFHKNEDLCEVSFKRFHEDKDSIYPDLTFVLPNRFNETVLKGHDKSFNEDNYRKFLSGGLGWDEKMLNIDFDKVSMRIDDYLIEKCFYATPHDMFYGKCEDNIIIKRGNNFGVAKFSLHFPAGMPMYTATIKLKRSIFYDGIRPANGAFAVLFAYPEQHYQGVVSVFYIWPLRSKEFSKNYVMKFVLKSMEVLRKREKPEEDCYDMENYDAKIEGTIIENFGCRPIDWVTNRSEPICTSGKILKEIEAEDFDQMFRLTKNKKYLEPCRTIKKFQIDYVEENVPSVEGDDEGEGWFIIELIINANAYTEVKQVRKYSIQSLVGNAGGYIGLCLGYAIWNVPAVVMDMWKHVRDTYI